MKSSQSSFLKFAQHFVAFQLPAAILVTIEMIIGKWSLSSFVRVDQSAVNARYSLTKGMSGDEDDVSSFVGILVA